MRRDRANRQPRSQTKRDLPFLQTEPVHGSSLTNEIAMTPSDKRGLNVSQAPIYQLPAEILSEIFVHYRNACMGDSVYSYRWVRIAHVCHHFREVALACASLWSDIRAPSFQTAKSMQRMQELLARSKQALISVRLHVNHSEEIRNLVVSEMHRTETLDITLPSRGFLTATSAPKLRFLSVEVYGHERTELRVAELFGAEDSPRLEHLRVASHAGLSWAKKTAFPRTLRVLQVTQHNRTPRPLDEILDVLDSLPLLEELALEGMLPPFLPTSVQLPPVRRTVTLRRLRYLETVGSASRTAVLLASLKLPALAHLKAKSVVTSQVALGLLGPVLVERLADCHLSDEAHFQSLTVDESSGPSETRLHAWSTRLDDNGTPSLDPPPARSLIMTLTHDRFLETLPSFITKLPLQHVQLLIVGLGTSTGSLFACEKLENWRAAFAAVPKVDELHVVGRRQPFPFRKPQPEHPETLDDFADDGELDPRRRDTLRLRRFYQQRPTAQQTQTEQETMWSRLCEIFPSVDKGAMNSWVEGRPTTRVSHPLKGRSVEPVRAYI